MGTPSKSLVEPFLYTAGSVGYYYYCYSLLLVCFLLLLLVFSSSVLEK